MTASQTIRRASTSEAGFLSELAMRSKAYWGYSPEFMESCLAELTIPDGQINSDDYDYHVAVEDEVVAGFYALGKLSATEYELEALFVEPDRIGKGIGRMLMRHALAELEQKNATSLLIQGDPNAEAFYLAAGARLIGNKESGSIPGRFLPLFQIEFERLTS